MVCEFRTRARTMLAPGSRWFRKITLGRQGPDRIKSWEDSNGRPLSGRLRCSGGKMMSEWVTRPATVALGSLLLATLALFPPAAATGDSPYAPSRDYGLQNVRTHLWFDLNQRKIRGEVSQSISTLREDVTSELRFDSVDLTIEGVTAWDGNPAKFSISEASLAVSLDRPAKLGERHEVFIRYEGRPQKGLYFILPDKNYPQQARGNLDAGRSRGHPILHSNLRLSQ